MTSIPIPVLLSRLKKRYRNAQIALNYSTPFELLVATILSAQCTDARVNIVTQSLFMKYRTIKDYATAKQSILEKDIHSTGFFRNKAHHIIYAARMVLDNYHGIVPHAMDEILTLPGVARKTANIVLGNAYGVIEGIAVDTHVIRLSQRLGLTTMTTPEKIERDLMKLIPKKDWLLFSYLIQQHGRSLCKARNPDCTNCFLNDKCPSAHLCSNGIPDFSKSI